MESSGTKLTMSGPALEHVKSSGTKITMSGAIAASDANKKTQTKFSMMNFKIFHTFSGFLRCPFTTLAKDSRHTWSLVYYLSEGFKAHLESGLLP